MSTRLRSLAEHGRLYLLPLSAYVITVSQHQTIAGEQKSAFLDINASIIQRSGLGPVFYILNVSDLHPLYSSNILFRYADDTYTS